MQLHERRGHRRARRRSGSCLPRTSSTWTAWRSTPADLDKLLTIDTARWQQEMGFREEHLAQFGGLPEEIWEAHRRVAAALGE